jgi:hypothetical protein
MGPLDFFQSLMHRTSQFTVQDWLLTFACAIVGYYALQIARR